MRSSRKPTLKTQKVMRSSLHWELNQPTRMSRSCRSVQSHFSSCFWGRRSERKRRMAAIRALMRNAESSPVPRLRAVSGRPVITAPAVPSAKVLIFSSSAVLPEKNSATFF